MPPSIYTYAARWIRTCWEEYDLLPNKKKAASRTLAAVKKIQAAIEAMPVMKLWHAVIISA